MLKHETRPAITVGNKVIHNFFSVDLASLCMESSASPVIHSFPIDDLR